MEKIILILDTGRENFRFLWLEYKHRLGAIKVTVYLVRGACSTCKQCNAYALNCKCLSPYIKLKIIEKAVKLSLKF